MPKDQTLAGSISPEFFIDVLDVCSQLPDVRREVRKNHDDNLWWPLYVTDWRLRMVIAGWSTRISYALIGTYQRVVAEVNEMGYEKLVTLSDSDLRSVIALLGLFELRKNYLRSLAAFLRSNDEKVLLDTPNDALIELIAEKVNGAGYKVAQCAVLYAKGYQCGIFPVDSGMKDVLGPCLGLRMPSGPKAHEVMRGHLEALLNETQDEARQIAGRNGYSDLNIPAATVPVWWAHLVLIYFKRLYCNRKKPGLCPLRINSRTSGLVGSMCNSDDL